MKMVTDTKDISISGKSPDQAILAIQEARESLPEGSTDCFMEIRGSTSDLFQVCRLVFKRPQTAQEAMIIDRYQMPRFTAVAA